MPLAVRGPSARVTPYASGASTESLGAMDTEISSPDRLVRIIKACVWALGALVVLKFLVLLSDNDWDPSKAPWALLVLVAVPVIGLTLLLDKRPRAGALLAGLLLAVFGATVVAALLRDGLARQAWADYPFAYGGLVAAAIGIACAVKVRTADKQE